MYTSVQVLGPWHPVCLKIHRFPYGLSGTHLAHREVSLLISVSAFVWPANAVSDRRIPESMEFLGACSDKNATHDAPKHAISNEKVKNPYPRPVLCPLNFTTLHPVVLDGGGLPKFLTFDDE